MNNNQLLLLLRAEGPELDWLSKTDDGSELPAVASGHAESVQQLLVEQPALRHYPTLALVPGEQVLTVAVEVPPKWSAQVLGWAVEEQITSAPEQVFICPLGDRSADGRLPVAVLDRQLMAGWHKTLQQSGLRVTALLPDYLALDLHQSDDNQVGAIEAGERTLVRCSSLSGVALPNSWLATWQTLTSHSVVQQAVVTEQPVLQTLAAMDSTQTAPVASLLQGEFRLSATGKSYKSLRPALSMIAAAVVLQIGLFIWDSIDLSSRKQALDGDITELFQRVMGPEARMVKPVHQLRTRLASQQAGASQSLLMRMQQLAQVWPETGVKVSSMTADADSLRVVAEVDGQVWPEFEQRASGIAALSIAPLQASTESGARLVSLEVRE